MGVSGCGKSTVAHQLCEALNLPFIEADDFHPEANLLKMENGQPLNDNDREPWLQNLALELKKEEAKGSSTAHIEISNHERTAYPFAAYILTVIGISVASRKSREGVGKNLVIGLCCSLV